MLHCWWVCLAVSSTRDVVSKDRTRPATGSTGGVSENAEIPRGSRSGRSILRVSRACCCCSPSPLAHARPSEARGTTSLLTVGAADGPVKVRNMLCGSQFGASGTLVVVLHEERLLGRRVEVGMESAARRGKEGEAKVKNENVLRDLGLARGTYTFLARRSRCPKSILASSNRSCSHVSPPLLRQNCRATPTCWDDDAVAVESIRSVDEWECVMRSCCIVERDVGEGDGHRTLSIVGCGVVWRWLAPSATP